MVRCAVEREQGVFSMLSRVFQKQIWESRIKVLWVLFAFGAAQITSISESLAELGKNIAATSLTIAGTALVVMMLCHIVARDSTEKPTALLMFALAAALFSVATAIKLGNFLCCVFSACTTIGMLSAVWFIESWTEKVSEALCLIVCVLFAALVAAIPAFAFTLLVKSVDTLDMHAVFYASTTSSFLAFIVMLAAGRDGVGLRELDLEETPLIRYSMYTTVVAVALIIAGYFVGSVGIARNWNIALDNDVRWVGAVLAGAMIALTVTPLLVVIRWSKRRAVTAGVSLSLLAGASCLGSVVYALLVIAIRPYYSPVAFNSFLHVALESAMGAFAAIGIWCGYWWVHPAQARSIAS